MSDNQPKVPHPTDTDASDDDRAHATVEQPLNGPKRSNGKALLALLAFFVVLGLLYWLGVEFLIDAD